MSLGHLTWAMRAQGLDPPAKLVLILAANAGDQDGRLFEPFDDLERDANLTPEALVEVVFALTLAQMAAFALAEDPATGEMRRCLQILSPEVPDGR